MNSSLQKALNHLTGQDDINAVSVKFLENLVTKYPYFPVVHVLLSKKLKESGNDNYLPQIQKTALYFSNPYWLYYQVAPQLPGEIITHNDEPGGNPPVLPDEDDLQVIPDQFHPEPENIQEEFESGGEYTPEEAGSGAHENKGGSYTEATPESYVPVNGEPDETVTTPSDDNVSADVPRPVSISEEELTEDEKLLHEISHNEKTTIAHENHEAVAVPTEDAAGNAENSLEKKVTHALEGHHAFSKEIEERTQALINPPDPSNPVSVAFEPFHTIDYFASQGIQLILENNPQDKLGKQLKSFTQWLKHMKRLGPEDALNSVKESHLEHAIQDIADTSNTPRDIVTETMATVLEKQGKTEKAIELYTKLSFLNPDKSAYFADKIHNLKGN